MTRKDFELIAAAILTLPHVQNRRQVAEALAEALAAANPRFDRERFLKACEA